MMQLLVANKNQSENIKNIVSELQIKNIKEANSHKKGYRPWGFYISILKDKRWQVKIIHINRSKVITSGASS